MNTQQYAITGYDVVDSHTQRVVKHNAVTATTSAERCRKAAHRTADRLDAVYGAVRYVVRPCRVLVHPEAC